MEETEETHSRKVEESDETRSSVDGGSIYLPDNNPTKLTAQDGRGRLASYGDYFWNRSALRTTDHDSSPPFDDDLLMDLDSGSTAALRMDRTHDDLNKFRQRIENNVEQQREYSEMMASLQNKVSGYRRNIAELDSRMGGGGYRSHNIQDSSMTLLDNLDNNSFGRDMEMWSPTRNIRNVNVGSSMGVTVAGDPNANYEMIAKLDDERRRSEEYRMQWENERNQKDRLEDENVRLRQEFERYAREYQDKERGYVNREKNLAQYLSDEQQKMLDTWTELQRVRKQFSDYKQKTAEEIEIQREDFKKALRNVSSFRQNVNVSSLEGMSGSGTGFVSGNGGGSTTTQNIDTQIFEVVKRLKSENSQNQSSDVNLLEELKKIRGDGSSESDSQMHKDLMIKYEEAIERNIELESKGDENQRRLADLEAELRRTKERLSDSSNVLRKMHRMAQESDRDMEGGSSKRTRSLSPGKSSLPPAEALRAVRSAIRNRDTDIQQLERKLKISEGQVKEFMSKFEGVDEIRRRLDKQLTDSRRELSTQQKTVDDLERSSRRFEDKLRSAEAEVTASEKARKILEDQLAKLRASFHQTSSDDAQKMIVHLDEQTSGMELDHKNRIDELNSRIESLVRENNKMKMELSPLRDKFRDMETDYNNTLRRLEEKEKQLNYVDDMRRNLQKDFEAQRSREDAHRSEHDKISMELEMVLKSSHLAEQQLKELKTQRDDFQKQKDDLGRQLAEIRNKFETERKVKETIEKTGSRVNDEIERLRQTLDDSERQIVILRRHNDELDTTIKGQQGKLAQSDNELHSKAGELEKMNELNLKLQREKQETLKEKLKSDADWQDQKEVIRKLELEMDKIRAEFKIVVEKEQQASTGLTQQMNRANVLSRMLEEKKQDIEHLQERIRILEEDLQRIRNEKRTSTSTTIKREIMIPVKSSATGETETKGEEVMVGYEDDMLSDLKIREINEKWRLQVEKLENERDDLLRCLREMEDEASRVGKGNERQENDFSELKRKHATEIERLRSEINGLHDKHLSDLDDEKQQYSKAVESLKLTESDLRDKVQTLEKQLAETQNRENELEREKKDNEEKLTILYNQSRKLREELEDLRVESDREIQKWKTDSYAARSEVKTLETTNTALTTQVQAGVDRIESLNRTVIENNTKIREFSSQVRRLEEELSDAKSSLSTKEIDLESAQNRLRNLEEQYSQLQSDSSTWRNDLDVAQRENDLLKSGNADLESELNRIRPKLKLADEQMKGMKNSLEHLRTEKEKLQNSYRDKSKQAEHLHQLSQQFDSKIQKLRSELNITSDKLITAENDRATLKNEMVKLQQELKFGVEQMQRKSDEYQTTLDDLANAHRAAEDGRLNALQDLETRKYENNDLTSRLENSEQRLITLQQEFITADSQRDILADALRRFQSSASRVININRFRREGYEQGTEGQDVDIDRATDVNYFQSVHMQPSMASDYGGRDGTAVFKMSDNLDVPQLEASLNILLNRVEKLEMERNELRDTLNRLQQKTNESHSTINITETRFRTIEENLISVEDEKRVLETRLSSAKQLLVSQEESLKQRDDERRQMKSKMVAAELQARGKEAQLRHLNEQLNNLRIDLDNAHSDNRSLRDKEESWDASRFQLEGKLREHDSEKQRLQLQLTTFESERQTTSEKIKELSGALRLSESKVQDMRDDVEKLRKDLSKTESIESELRRNMDSHSKTSLEYQMIKDQLLSTQNDLNSSNTRRQQLESELTSVRNDLRDYKQRSHDNTSRISELQRQLQDASAEKHRLEDRNVSMEKTLSQQKVSEKDARQQLEAAKNAKRELLKELDDFKRRLSQLEEDRRNHILQLDGWKKEKHIFLKKIEALEHDKRRTEVAIKETALQREAIEKSLNAMERENKALYKSSAQLQQQIAQLEMENGNRILDLTSRQREEQEIQLSRMRQEKVQIENLIENRVRTHKSRVKQLEDQVATLRDQLDKERQRRREYADRSMANDIGRLGGNVLGISSYGNSGGIDAFLNGGTRSVGYGAGFPRSTFTSNFTSDLTSQTLTPPLRTSTPTRIDYSSFGRRYDDIGTGGSLYGGCSVRDRDFSYGGRDVLSGRDQIRELKGSSIVQIPSAPSEGSPDTSLHSSSQQRVQIESETINKDEL